MATDARQALDTDARIRQLTQFVRGLTLGGRQATEDLVEETLFRAWHNLDSLPQDNAGRSRRWLFTVARRLVIDEARRRQARPAGRRRSGRRGQDGRGRRRRPGNPGRDGPLRIHYALRTLRIALTEG